MPNVSFSGLLIVAIVAFLAPLLLALTPARRLPAIVLEIMAGIVIGPSVLGWVKVDLPISILSVLGLAFLLFLAGLEVELEKLRGRLLVFVGSAFLISLGLALLVGYGLYFARQVVSPLLIAIILVATGLGIVIPVLKDAGESDSDFGQLVIAGAMFAEFGSIILLSLFFSREATSTATKLVLLGGFVLLAVGFAFVVLRLEHAVGRLCCACLTTRTRNHSWCIYSRRDSAIGRWRPDDDTSAVSPEAGGDRLRCFYPGLFRDERHPVRSGGALLKPFDSFARTNIPYSVAARPGCACPPLSSTRRHSSFGRGRTLAGNIAFVHRCSIADRSGTRPDYKGDGGRPHSGWTAVCPDLASACSHYLTPC